MIASCSRGIWYCGSLEWAMAADSIMHSTNVVVIITPCNEVFKYLKKRIPGILIELIKKNLDPYPAHLTINTFIHYVKLRRDFRAKLIALVDQYKVESVIINDNVQDQEIVGICGKLQAEGLNVKVLSWQVDLNQRFTFCLRNLVISLFQTLLERRLIFPVVSGGEIRLFSVLGGKFPVQQLEVVDSKKTYEIKLLREKVFILGGSISADSQYYNKYDLIEILRFFSVQGFIFKLHPGHINDFKKYIPNIRYLDFNGPVEAIDFRNCIVATLNSTSLVNLRHQKSNVFWYVGLCLRRAGFFDLRSWYCRHGIYEEKNVIIFDDIAKLESAVDENYNI